MISYNGDPAGGQRIRGGWQRPQAPLLIAILVSALPCGMSAQEVTLFASGDIEWSRAVKPPPAYVYQPTDEVLIPVRGEPSMESWTSIPYLNRREHWPEIAERSRREMIGGEIDHPSAHHRASVIYPLEFQSVEEESRHPFQQMRYLIRGADIAFANLEMPLSDRARHTGAFLGRPAFADAVRWAGFDVVSVANNHAFDAEELGLLDTMDALEKAGVGHVGAGTDLADASRPHIVEVDGVSFAFLGYTYGVNVVGDWGFANEGMSGVLPLDPILIKQHIRAVRDQVDHVVLSFHWAIENAKHTHPDARAFAREMIDEGADIILGHHPHVTRGVEVYNGGVVLYSLGNFVFGHNHTYWTDNYAVEISVTPDRISRIEIIPIAGQGNDMAQPYVLEGHRAQVLLRDVQTLSAELGTTLLIAEDRGVVTP
ncbi:MAG: CapA family protein [Dehalococcoidia bacterium]